LSLSILDLFGIRHHNGSRFRWRLTRWRQPRHHGNRAIGLSLADFDQTHSATGNHAQVVMPAIVWHLDAGALGGLYQVFLGTNLHFDIIDKNGSHREYS
jgi:hypothetical protein